MSNNEIIAPNDFKIEKFDSLKFGNLTTITDNSGITWFIGREITKSLGYTNASKALNDHVDKDDRKTLKYKACNETLLASLWGNNDFSDRTLINESGLYSLILGSKLKEAKQYKRWVTSEVLPSIRKNGMYIGNKALNDADFTLQVLAKLKEQIEKNKQLSEAYNRLDERLKIIEEKDVRNIEIDVTNEQASQIEDFVSAYMEDKTDITLTELHKILKQSNLIKVGRNEFCSWLRMNGYLGNSKEDNTYNVPTTLSVDKELFVTKEYSYFNYYTHEKTVCINPRVTAIGLDFFMRVFLTIKNHKKNTITEVAE